MDRSSLEDLFRRVSNWGRWGDDDERGTLNHITPQAIVAACGSVRAGRVIALGVPLERTGPQLTAPRRYNPIHYMDRIPTDTLIPGSSDVGVADDILVLPLQSATQWDSLAHIAYKGQLYGGRPAASVTSRGASVNSIRAISGSVIGRGVLVDVARHLGVEALAPAQGVTAADLEATLRAEGVRVASGDILLVRTGFLEKCRAAMWQGFHGASPGLAVDTVEWIHEHEIAAVASDTAALEMKPWDSFPIPSPVHVAALVHMGLLIGEIFDLEALAADCAADGRYDFLFVAPPLPVTGGVGSTINPYAVK